MMLHNDSMHRGRCQWSLNLLGSEYKGASVLVWIYKENHSVPPPLAIKLYFIRAATECIFSGSVQDQSGATWSSRRFPFKEL